MTPSQGDSIVTLARRHGAAVYFPFVLAQFGRGMLLPIVPLYLRDVGLSFTTISVVLAALGLGAFLGGLPVGGFASRIGPDRLFVAAVGATAVTSALFGASTAVIALAGFRLLAGFGSVGLRVASQMLVNARVTTLGRGRAMSLLGGAMRTAFFIGPLVGGVLVDTVGFETAFVACGLVTLLGMVPFVGARRGARTASMSASATRFERPAGPRGDLIGDLIGSWRRHGMVLLVAGTGAALVMTAREGRNVVVPLIGDELGLSASAVGVLVAIGTGADLALFPVAGSLMDRFGRLYAIVPAFSLLAIGLFVLGVVDSAGGAVVAGVVMGIGNGMSAGTMLTLGGDLAPADSGAFLAALGMMQDVGVMIGPLVVGWLADSAGLDAAAIVLAVVLFVAIAWIALLLGDTRRPTRAWLVARLEQR